jgi:hypothetical protein
MLIHSAFIIFYLFKISNALVCSIYNVLYIMLLVSNLWNLAYYFIFEESRQYLAIV